MVLEISRTPAFWCDTGRLESMRSWNNGTENHPASLTLVIDLREAATRALRRRGNNTNPDDQSPSDLLRTNQSKSPGLCYPDLGELMHKLW